MNLFKKVLPTTLAALLVSGTMSFSQPHKDHGGRGRGDRGERGFDHGSQRGIQELLTYSGKVISYIPNNDKIYDAFQLNSNGNTWVIRFPKHMGKELMAAAKANSEVTVKGIMHYNREGAAEIRLVTLTAGNAVVNDTPPLRQERTADKLVTIDSKVTDFRVNQKGETDGIILSDKSILSFPPHSGMTLTNQIKKNDSIKGTGYLRQVQEGVVFSEPVKLIRAHTLDVNGKSYLID